MIQLFTIGFTQKSAERFFELLKNAGTKLILDTRLNNHGQLAGFSKRDDLRFFADKLASATYLHWLESAPTAELLSAYKSKKITWDEYAKDYRGLLASRQIEKSSVVGRLNYSCLLCSEAKPHNCHRRLLAEYLQEHLSEPIQVTHLV